MARRRTPPNQRAADKCVDVARPSFHLWTGALIMVTSYRCCHCHNALTKDEVLYYEYSCERCEAKLQRRWDDRYSAQPSKFAQRLAIVMAIAIIAVCVVVMKKISGGVL